MLKQFIAQLAKEMGADEMITVDNGDSSFIIHLDSDLNLLVREDDESEISLFTIIGPFPEGKREEFLLKTMIANLFGRETGGAALGLDKMGKQLTLLTFLPRQLNYKEFYDYLEDFANYADAWKTETLAYIEQKTD